MLLAGGKIKTSGDIARKLAGSSLSLLLFNHKWSLLCGLLASDYWHCLSMFSWTSRKLHLFRTKVFQLQTLSFFSFPRLCFRPPNRRIPKFAAFEVQALRCPRHLPTLVLPAQDPTDDRLMALLSALEWDPGIRLASELLAGEAGEGGHVSEQKIACCVQRFLYVWL